MKIALVLPPAERISERKDAPKYQHIGLGYLAAVLERNNIDVKVINSKLERLDIKQALGAISDYRPDILGITAMTHEINMAMRLAEETKKILPQAINIIGGVHITALPEDTLRRCSFFDIGIIGEGEDSILDIVKAVQKKDHSFSSIRGIVYRDKENILLSEPRQGIEDLDRLPFPAWHQFPKATEYMIITARGCPYTCIFCMQAMGHKVRKRSPSNVVDEIEKILAERRPERFLFYDETFTIDKKRVYEICDLIIKRGITSRINWAATTRVDTIDRDILLKMKEAGCNHIEFGIESGDQKMLERIEKRITLKQAENAVALAKELGFHTEGAFILGHPCENLETACRTIDFAARLNPDIVQIGIMVPYPGTKIAEMAKRGEGGYRLISNNWLDYNKQLGNALELEGLSRPDLERLQMTGYIKLFIANRRFIDFIRFIWNYRIEMLSFLKNHFKKRKNPQQTKLNFSAVIRILFTEA